MLRAALLASLVVPLAIVSGCATPSPDVVRYHQTQREAPVQDGVVLSIRPVKIDGTQTGYGALAGSVAGGVAGSTIGGWREGLVGGVVGAVVGGVVGNAVERSATTQEADEILVQMKNGQRRAIVQVRGAEALREGDAVLVIGQGRGVRVTRAPANMAPAQAPAQPAPAPREPNYIAPGDPIT